MTYSGGWLRRAFYTEPGEKLHNVSSEEHAAGDHNEDQDINAFVYQAPPLYAAADDIGEYPDLYYMADSPGIILDTTTQDHAGTKFSPIDARLGVNGEHSSGDDIGSTHAWEGYRANWEGDAYTGMRWEDSDSTDFVDGQNSPLARGMNSNAINQPDGYRAGWNWNTWVDRKQYVQLNRQHETRISTPNIAAAATDTPPVPSPYGTPFRNLARSITRSNTPMLRREPQNLSESYMDGGDSEENYASEYDDWYVG